MSNGPGRGAASPVAVGPKVTSVLTEVERGILDFMIRHLRARTYQPSIREIGREFGIKSTKTVSEHLQALADKGFLERDPSRSRGIRILGVDLHAKTASMPWFGSLAEAAGARRKPASAHMSLDRQLVEGRGAFVVRANAQLGALGIEEGDQLVVEPVLSEELADGQLIVASIGGAPDYYRLERRGSRASLHPVAGRAPATRIDEPASLVIVGRVSALVRRIRPLPAGRPGAAPH